VDLTCLKSPIFDPCCNHPPDLHKSDPKLTRTSLTNSNLWRWLRVLTLGTVFLTQPFSLSFSLTAVNECPVTSPSSPCRHRRPSGVSFPTLSLSLSPPFGLVIDSRQGSAVVVDQGRRCGGAPLPPFYPSLPLSLVVSCGGWVEKTPLAHVLLAKKAKVA